MEVKEINLKINSLWNIWKHCAVWIFKKINLILGAGPTRTWAWKENDQHQRSIFTWHRPFDNNREYTLRKGKRKCHYAQLYTEMYMCMYVCVLYCHFLLFYSPAAIIENNQLNDFIVNIVVMILLDFVFGFEY